MRSAGHGATSAVLALSGTTSSVISFGAVIQSSFTVYTGGAKGQILNGDANWLHGHWNGNAGVARYVNGWQTAVQDNVNPDTDWVVMCGGNAGWSQLTLW